MGHISSVLLEVSRVLMSATNCVNEKRNDKPHPTRKDFAP